MIWKFINSADFKNLNFKRMLLIVNVLVTFALLAAVSYSGLVNNDPSKLHGQYLNYAIPAAVSEIGYGLDGYRLCQDI